MSCQSVRPVCRDPELENELGVTIVQHGHRFASFTAEGLHVVGCAHRILAERDALRTDLERMRHGPTSTLRIDAIPTAAPATALLTDPFRAQPRRRVFASKRCRPNRFCAGWRNSTSTSG